MFRTPMIYCPSCDNKLNAVTDATDENSLPSEGDVSVCFYCGTVLQFDADLDLSLASQEIIDEIKRESPETWKTIQSIQMGVKNKKQS